MNLVVSGIFRYRECALGTMASVLFGDIKKKGWERDQVSAPQLGMTNTAIFTVRSVTATEAVRPPSFAVA